ncbi:hypothetical protein BV22DRAFT_983436, partial [Leucogyrophana mollusca]
VKRSQHADVVNETLALLKEGSALSSLRLSTSLPVLRERSLHWLISSWRATNKPDIVKQAFSLCNTGGDFNLSFDSLTSRATLKLLRDTQKNEPEVWSRITMS